MEYDTAVQLRKELLASGVEVSSWGIGATKRVDDLAAEIDAGEGIVMIDDETGEITRFIESIALDVLTSTRGNTYHLVEDRQEFANGAIRRRYLSTSLGEKILPGESYDEAARRAMCEELGILAVVSLTYDGNEYIDRVSRSYPGIASALILHHMTARIEGGDDVSAGYVEERGGKTTYFVWEALDSKLHSDGDDDNCNKL